MLLILVFVRKRPSGFVDFPLRKRTLHFIAQLSVARTSNPTTLEAQYQNGVDSIPHEGNSLSLGGWVDCETTYNPALEEVLEQQTKIASRTKLTTTRSVTDKIRP